MISAAAWGPTGKGWRGFVSCVYALLQIVTEGCGSNGSGTFAVDGKRNTVHPRSVHTVRPLAIASARVCRAGKRRTRGWRGDHGWPSRGRGTSAPADTAASGRRPSGRGARAAAAAGPRRALGRSSARRGDGGSGVWSCRVGSYLDVEQDKSKAVMLEERKDGGFRDRGRRAAAAARVFMWRRRETIGSREIHAGRQQRKRKVCSAYFRP